MKSLILCLGFQGEPLTQILSRVPPEVTNVLLCPSQPPFPSQSGLVAWIYTPAVMDEWTDDGTYLGQEEDQAPTVALQRGGHRVRVRFASAWFDEAVSAEVAEGALHRVQRLIQKQFRVEDPNLSSPVQLGRHLMAASWNRDEIRVPPAPPEVRELLQTIGPQGRHECLTLPELETIPALYGYDMRLAYLWCCKGLPFGHVERTQVGGHKVRLTWQAPEGWAHIGLLPQRQQGWQYPLAGEGWADLREIEMALRNGWALTFAEGLLWDREGALDRWAEGLQWCLRQSKEDEVVYRLLRRVALNTIGSLHRSSVRRSRALPAGGRGKPPSGNPSLRLSADGAVYYWQEETALNNRALLYCHPEWTTTIWARCRARLAQAALQFPREQVIALRQDALFVTAPHPTWKCDGGIGSFRVKESYHGAMPAPHTLEALQELRVIDDD